MTAKPVLGVLRLDYSYGPVVGDVDHPGSFSYEAIYRTIPGLTFAICQSGKITDDIKRNCVTATQFLEAQGVSGITGDCGFMINIEALVRSQTDKPVFLSSLDQLPLILASIGPQAEIGVLTANDNALHLIEARLDRLAGVAEHSPRLHIVGCQNIPGFEAVANGERVDTKKVSVGLRKLVADFLASNTNVKCLLFECTELGVYANEIRLMSGLPVYDAITHCDAFMSGFVLNKRFGRQS